MLRTFAQTQLEISPLHGDVNEDYDLTRIINCSTDHATSFQPLPPRVSERTRQLFQLRRSLQYGGKSGLQAVEYAEVCKLVRKSLKEDLRARHLAILRKAVQSGQFRAGRKELVYARHSLTLLRSPSDRTPSSCSDPLTETVKTIKSLYNNLYHSSHGPQQPPLDPIHIRLSTSKVEEALKSRKTRSSPGSDRVLSSSLRPLCTIIADVKKLAFAETILLYKSGDPADVANYRPISLLPTIYKVITKALNTRLEKTANNLAILPQEQAGFREHFSTIHHIHTLNMLQEKSHEFNIPAYAIFIDFEKVFDTVELSAIWQALESFDVDDNLIKAIQLLYANGSAAVKIGEFQAELNIQRGVRQGDPLSPLLFTITLQYALNKMNFCNRGFKINGKALPYLAYADDIVLLSNGRHELENMARDLTETSKQIGLTINFEKTKWMKLNNTNDMDEKITEIEGQTIRRVYELCASNVTFDFLLPTSTCLGLPD
ncbi:reverse transcriptase [Ancylostoma duodenale]|uniref:Reverse transcriptase n=1 Tax=Ancylostoma duodenale TaxID=51022 RepID=A0A0C2DXZ8_9BILA|nr:reverse transcriptase [Ancylostoma duodenale]